MRTVGIMGVAFTAIAGALVAAGNTWVVTDESTLNTAKTMAQTGDTIMVSANVTAAVAGTLMTGFAPGLTWDRDTAGREFAGFCWLFDNAADYTKTTFKAGLIFNTTGVNASGVNRGGFRVHCGKFEIRCQITGATGSTVAKFGNTFNATCTNDQRVECDLIGAKIGTSSADVVSAFNMGGGVGSDGVTGSYVLATDCEIFGAGAGATDNWFTSHDGMWMEARGGSMHTAGSGPCINSARVDCHMALRGVDIDITGQAVDSHVSELEGCNIHGTPGAGVNFWLHSDWMAPTKPSLAVGNTSSCSILISTDVSSANPPIYYGNTIGAGRWIGSKDNATKSYKPFISAKNTINGSAGGIVADWSFESYNDTIGGGSGTFPIRAWSANVAGQIGVIRGARLNSTTFSPSGAVNYATRSDAGNVFFDIADSRTKAAIAIGYNTGNFSSTNSTTNDTEPSGVTTGVAGTHSDLAAKPWFAGLVAHMASQPGSAGVSGWGGGLMAAMGF